MQYEIVQGVLQRLVLQEGETCAVIPDGVRCIGDEACFGDENLESAVIPEGVTKIGELAFSDCTALRNVLLPESLVSIGAGAFHYCTALESIRIPESVQEIGEDAFACCYSLQMPVLPKGLTRLERSVFACCQFAHIVFPEGLTEIGSEAFEENHWLRQLTIPSHIRRMASHAFRFCHNLCEIVLHDNFEEIAEDCFWGSEPMSVRLCHPACTVTLSIPKCSEDTQRSALTLLLRFLNTKDPQERAHCISAIPSEECRMLLAYCLTVMTDGAAGTAVLNEHAVSAVRYSLQKQDMAMLEQILSYVRIPENELDALIEFAIAQEAYQTQIRLMHYKHSVTGYRSAEDTLRL